MDIHVNQELKASMCALTEAQVKTQRQELAELYIASQQLEDKLKQLGYKDYALLHGALTEIWGKLHRLPAHELMFFTWRYEPTGPNAVGDIDVRLTLFHNHGTRQGTEEPLLSVTVNYRGKMGSDEVDSDDVNMEGVLRNANSTMDSPTTVAESVIWMMAGYLEELRDDYDVKNALLVNQDDDKQVMIGYRLGTASMFIHANYGVLDSYKQYCQVLNRLEP